MADPFTISERLFPLPKGCRINRKRLKVLMNLFDTVSFPYHALRTTFIILYIKLAENHCISIVKQRHDL